MRPKRSDGLREHLELRERLDLATAERDALIASLRDVLRVVDSIGGYATHEQQAAIRVAKARIAESERLP